MSVSDDSPNDPSLSSSESDLDDFNLFDPEIQQCPHMYYAKMQKERGVFETDALGTPLYLVTKYEDVAACAMNTSAFSSRFDAGSMEGNSEYARRAQELYEQEGGFDRVGTMLTVDPPEHTRYRRLVSQAFTPKAIAALEPTIRELAGQLIDELISGTAIGQSLDFVELFAVPLPVAVIAKALNFQGPVICDIIIPREQLIIPTVSSRVNEDGSMSSRPLEDMFPFLDREEYRKNLFIKEV